MQFDSSARDDASMMHDETEVGMGRLLSVTAGFCDGCRIPERSSVVLSINGAEAEGHLGP